MENTQLQIKHMYAELFGTLGLTLVVLFVSNSVWAAWTPVFAALYLGLMVYNLGKVTGAHFNPAVTMGLLMTHKIKSSQALGYMMAQIGGAVIALLLFYIAKPDNNLNFTIDSDFGNMLRVLTYEALGTTFFTFGIAAVVWGKVEQGASGLVVGGSLLIGLLLASSLGWSAGILNPAVAIGTSSLNVGYFLGPIIGSIVGFGLFKYFAE